MLDDFDVIVKEFPADQKSINLYTLADVHIGAKECDYESLAKWIKTVKNDENAYWVCVGDMLNMGLRNAKTNIYEEEFMPYEQKELFAKLFSPISDKLIGMISGNHEARAVREIGINPLYDIACRWRKEDIYREHSCFIDISLGKGRNNKRLNYGVVVTHGASRGKYDKWTPTIDCVDLFISGHTHQNNNSVKGKLVFDRQNKVVRKAEFMQHVCTPFLGYGGYAVAGHYQPCNKPRYETFVLSGSSKDIEFRSRDI